MAPRTSDPSVFLPLTHVAYHILIALSVESQHGYAILKDVADRTGGAVELEAGTLYAAIKRMRDDGWIETAPLRPGADARRRNYALTELGREILLAECKRLEAMVELARSANMLPRSGSTGV